MRHCSGVFATIGKFLLLAANVPGIGEGGVLLLCSPGRCPFELSEFEITTKSSKANGQAQNR